VHGHLDFKHVFTMLGYIQFDTEVAMLQINFIQKSG